jgi:hypothetical protein
MDPSEPFLLMLNVAVLTVFLLFTLTPFHIVNWPV